MTEHHSTQRNTEQNEEAENAPYTWGGLLPQGTGHATNTTGSTEPILTHNPEGTP